jgi:hypothetical protein
MLARLTYALGNPLQGGLLDFTDTSEITPWAIESVEGVVAAGIMSGVGNYIFAPQQLYTREQSIATIMRMLDFAKHIETDTPPQGELSFEVGSVTIISNGTEHEPGIHHLHSAIYTDGSMMSVSGIPFEVWLGGNLSILSEIQYADSLQVVVDGKYGQIVTYRHQIPMNHDELTLMGIPAESFSDGAADISLPDEMGVYLLYVDVNWSGDGSEFTLLRYVFKIVK